MLCLTSAPSSDEIMMNLPVGDNRGRNCLIKLIVELTLMLRVFLAVYYEGISNPGSQPKPALAIMKSNKMLLFFISKAFSLIDSSLLIYS